MGSGSSVEERGRVQSALVVLAHGDGFVILLKALVLAVDAHVGEVIVKGIVLEV